MGKKLVLIHTMPFLVDVFSRLCQAILPDVKIWHVLDEPLLEHVRQAGGIQPDDVQQLQMHISNAENIGADAVLVTCSTLSPGVECVRADIPALKIDEAMITGAVELGSRIGVIATNPTTLEPTRSALLAQASRVSKAVDVHMHLVEGALAALLKGDGALHDELVRQAVAQIARQVDVIVLAQASTARVLDVVSEAEIGIPILASPQAALERLKLILSNP
jgi:Asp/Glu/hydantoin racemase